MFKNWFRREQISQQAAIQNHSPATANALQADATQNFASNYEFNQKMRLEQARYRLLGLIILSILLIISLPFLVKKPTNIIKPRLEIQEFDEQTVKSIYAQKNIKAEEKISMRSANHVEKLDNIDKFTESQAQKSNISEDATQPLPTKAKNTLKMSPEAQSVAP